jgi:glycosyltransferase involved in cell wall biosynthesis
MFAGRFDRTRGIYTLLDVLPSLSIGDDVEFWISGYGPDEEVEQVGKAVEQLGDDRVEFFGTLPWDEYRESLASADIFLNLQDPAAEISEYTFPSKLLDFMSVGGVVVSTDMSDLRETFGDLFHFVEGSESPEETLQETIGSYRRGECVEECERAQAWIREHCSHEQVGEDILSLFDT